MLIPKGRKKILEIFLKNPFKEIHLREIARLSNSSVTNVTNSMRLLVKNNIFIRNEVSNSIFFKPNLANDEAIKILEFLELERRKHFYEENKNIARMLKKYTGSIIEFSNKRIQLVILFGSVARGEWTKKSDVDILAVVPDKDKEITNVLNKAKTDVSPLLEIRPISTAINKFVHGFKTKTEFYNNLWQDRVILYNEFLFWQLIREGGNINA
jgi:predicted nucleotidyltransferase